MGLNRLEHEHGGAATSAARKSVLVLGGAAGTGAWLAENLWRREPGVTVEIADIAPPGSVRAGPLHLVAYEDDGVHGMPDLRRYDVIVVAVPIDQIELVARSTLPNVAAGTLVIDVASVKQDPMVLIDAALPADVSYIGVHPLFRPAVPSLVGQTVVVCPSRRSGRTELDWLHSLLDRHGAVVRTMSAADHDRAMALVQVLTHFTALTAASVIAERGPEFRRALELLTPPFRTLAGLVGRLMDIPEAPPNGPGARIYADIQTAAYADARAIRQTFIDTAGRLAAMADTGDAGALREEIQGIAEHFPADVLADCRQLFSQSSASAQAEALELYARRADGESCAFESMQQGRVVVGRVEDFSPTTVTVLVQSARRSKTDGTYSYAVGWDEASRAAAAQLGFNIPTGRREALPRGEYRLMAPSRFEAWRAKALEPHRRDVTVGVPIDMNGRDIVALLPRLVDGVLTSEPMSSYQPADAGHVRWTARLQLRGDVIPDDKVAELFNVLAGLSIAVPQRRTA